LTEEKIGRTPEMLTISQLAKRGILPERTIRRLVAERKIPVVRSGRTQYINYTLLCEQLSRGGGKLWGDG
jgi:excisionase family DNA binding protein